MKLSNYVIINDNHLCQNTDHANAIVTAEQAHGRPTCS